MKHKHHIIPKHMGGNDDPSNLIELTVEEQSEETKLKRSLSLSGRKRPQEVIDKIKETKRKNKMNTVKEHHDNLQDRPLA